MMFEVEYTIRLAIASANSAWDKELFAATKTVRLEVEPAIGMCCNAPAFPGAWPNKIETLSRNGDSGQFWASLGERKLENTWDPSAVKESFINNGWELSK